MSMLRLIARFSSEELAGKLLPKPVELQSLTEDYCHSQSFVSLNNNLPRDSTMKDIDADEEMLIMRKIAQNAMDSLCSLIELTRRHFPLCWIHTLRTLQCLLMEQLRHGLLTTPWQACLQDISLLLRGKKDILLTIETTIATNAIYAFVYVLGLANEICAPMQTALPRQVGRRLLQEILGRAHYFCFNSFLQQAAGRPFTQVSWEVIKGVLSALKSTDTDTVASLALCLWKPQLVQPVSLYSSIILQGKLVCCTLLKDKQIKTRLSKHIHADLHMPLHSEPNASQTYRHAGDPSDVESSESLFSLSSVDSITSNDDASSQYQYKPNSNTPTKHKDGNAAKKCTGLESMHRMFSDINTAQSGEGVVIKRKRGRPPKTVQPSSTSRAKTQSKDFTFLSKQQGRESAPDRKRGRPLTAAPSLSASSTMKRDGVPVSALANSSVPLRASETSSSHKQSPNGSGRPVSHRQAALDANINLRLCRDEDDDNEDGMVVIDDSSLSTQHRKQSNLLSVSHSSSAVSSQDTSLVSSSTSQPTSAAATLQETNRQDSYLQFTKEPTKKKRGRPLGSGRPLVPLAFEFNDLESLGEDAGESSEIFWSLLIIRFFRAVAHIPCAYFGHKKDNRIRLETSLYHLVTTSSRDNTICEPTDEEFADAVMKYNINAYWLKQWLHVMNKTLNEDREALRSKAMGLCALIRGVQSGILSDYMFTDGMLQMFPMPAELLKGRSSKASSCTRGMVNQEDSMLVSVQAGNVEVTSAGHKSHKAASLNEQDGVMHETESYFDVLIE